MVLSKARRLLSALKLAATAVNRPARDLAKRAIRCASLVPGILSLTAGLSVQANPVSTVSTAPLPQRAAILPKGEQIDKSTLRFEQTQFEQRRLEVDRLRQSRLEQARIEHLRRLLAPLDSSHQLAQASAILSSTAPRSTSGIYLYGQQPTPDQLATTYFVFDLQESSITGAFYMPSSSFDCVRGQLTHGQILLSVTDSYSQETSPYALSLSPPTAVVASQPGPMIAPLDIVGFYPLPISDQSQELLAVCQARYR